MSQADLPTSEHDVHTDEMVVNMGPQHPSTHGVLRLVLRTDGEVVLDVQPVIGYLHRCAEKIGENLTARQWLPYTDRFDYLAAMNMNLGWALTVEKLLGLEVTEKCRHLRVAVCELNRIASHLVAMGCYGLDLGSFTPFMYAFREREYILDLFESISGARLTYSYITPGGVTGDFTEGWIARCEAFLSKLEPIINHYHAVLTSNEVFIRRCANVGVLSAEQAIAFGCSGPVLRGSGVDWDLRRDGEPIYARMYQDYQWDVIVQKNGRYPGCPSDPQVPAVAVVGDSWHRYFVRMLEVVQSIRIIRQAVERYARCEGGIGEPIKVRQKLPVGEAYLETEAPKGQMGFWIVGNGTDTPSRVRARSSSFCNLSIMSEICKGCLVADVPAILGSIDIVLGEIDR